MTRFSCLFRHLVTGSASIALFSYSLGAADFALRTREQAAPKEIGATIQERLQNKGVQIVDRDSPVYEFWFVREVSFSKEPASAAKSLEALKSAILLGAMSVPKSRRDYRDNELHEGVYTMRFGLQPQDGNHLGSSEFPYFIVLIPAKLDPTADGIKDYKSLVKASSQQSSTEHPVVLSLRPVSGAPEGAPQIVEPATDHKAIRLKLPGKVEGGSAVSTLAFDLVFEGTATH